MKAKVKVTTDNIFEDLGLEDAAELKVRSDLLSEVVNIIMWKTFRIQSKITGRDSLFPREATIWRPSIFKKPLQAEY